VFHGLSLAEKAVPGVKGGWIAPQFHFHSEMGQNFWIAITGWSVCFLLTTIISFVTKRTKTDAQLNGLVYSLTPKPTEDHEPWYERPVVLGLLVLAGVLILNILFW
jgi:SSS family solute:Na+ symporter